MRLCVRASMRFLKVYKLEHTKLCRRSLSDSPPQPNIFYGYHIENIENVEIIESLKTTPKPHTLWTKSDMDQGVV